MRLATPGSVPVRALETRLAGGRSWKDQDEHDDASGHAILGHTDTSDSGGFAVVNGNIIAGFMRHGIGRNTHLPLLVTKACPVRLSQETAVYPWLVRIRRCAVPANGVDRR